MTPSTADGTDFGTAVQGDTAVSHTFTVRNDGGSILTLGVVMVPEGFTLTEGLSGSLMPGASDTFTVRRNLEMVETRAGDITFSNNDANDNPFNFRITGTVFTPPEIGVTGNGVSITDGDVTPSIADGTDFGVVFRGSNLVSRTFTVYNYGSATWTMARTLGAVTVPTGFTLTDGLVARLPSGATDTFTVQLDTAIAGTWTGDVSFANNDLDEDPFNFRITGTIIDEPEIVVLGNGVSITDGDVTPSTVDGTDFGVTLAQARTVSRTFTVRNDGSGPLTVGAIVVPTGYTVTRSLPACLPAGGADTFVVRLDTAVPGVKSGEVRFENNDRDENPFNFTVTGTVLGPGDLDPSFGQNGLATTGVATPNGLGRSVVVQSDRKIVVAGFYYNGNNYDFALARYNTDGTPDLSFGMSGMVTTDFGGTDDYAYALALLPSGFAVVGCSYNGSNYDFAIAKYTSSGSLYLSFSGDGKTTTAFGSGDDIAYGVAIRGSDTIVAVGSSYNGANDDLAIAQYKWDGTLDSSFSGDGMLTTAFGSGNDCGYDAAINSSGRLVVAGFSSNGSNDDFAVARYNSNGCRTTPSPATAS